MKCAFVIFLASLGTTLAVSRRRPELLLYQVSEKNGEPEVDLIKTQDIHVDENNKPIPVEDKNNGAQNQKKSLRSIDMLDNKPHRHDYFKNNKKQLKKYHIDPNDDVVTRVDLNDFNSQPNDYSPQLEYLHKLKQMNDLNPSASSYYKKGQTSDYNNHLNEFDPPQNYFEAPGNEFDIRDDDELNEQEEKIELIKNLKKILKRLKQYDDREKRSDTWNNYNNANPKENKIYVGTLTNDEVDEFLSSQLQNNQPRQRLINVSPQHVRSILRRGRNDDRDQIDDGPIPVPPSHNGIFYEYDAAE